MTLFIDNDALWKLASWNLLREGIEACDYTPADVRYLPSVPFVFRLGKPGCKLPPTVATLMLQIMAEGKECREDPPPHLSKLPTVDDVDAGDAILLAQAAVVPGAVLSTGDKRCIRAAASSPAYAEVVRLLAGRVVCLEQVVLRVIELRGFDEVKQRVVGSGQLHVDEAVRAAFGSGWQADEMNACFGLESKVSSLAASSGGMLAPRAFRFSVPTDG